MVIRTMLVYDQISLYETMTDILSTAKDIHMTAAAIDINTLRDLLNQDPTDVILLDLDSSHPGMRQITTALREDENSPPAISIVRDSTSRLIPILTLSIRGLDFRGSLNGSPRTVSPGLSHHGVTQIGELK